MGPGQAAEARERLKRLLAGDPALAGELAALVVSGVIGGDGNVIGDHSSATVFKLSGGEYAIQAERLEVTLPRDQLLALLASAYSPPSLPEAGELVEPGRLPPGSRVVFGRNALFTGREAALKRLARALLHEDHPSALVTQAVAGMGGVGKTQLAVEFAYRYGRFFHGVHWVNCQQEAAIGAEVAACGERMCLPYWPEKLPEQVARTLDAWCRGGPRLVVLDNLEEVDPAREWLGRLSGGAVRVVVTARRRNWPRDLGLDPLRLAVFSPPESRAFLREYLGEERATDAELDRLAERLGRLPLALELAGRYLEGLPRLTVEEYLDKIEDVWADPSMQDWNKKLGSPTGHDLDLAKTFALSWERVEDETARRVFLMLGWCAPNEAVPWEVLEEGLRRQGSGGFWRRLGQLVGKRPREERCDATVGVLAGLGLVEVEDPRAGPVVHPLLAEYARTLPGTGAALGAVAGTVVKLAAEANATGLPAMFAPLQAHVEAVAPRAEGAGLDNAGTVWNELGYHLYQGVANYARARECFERALGIDERVFGPDHPRVATDVNNLGGVLQGVGDLEGARAAYERALGILEKVLGPEHPNVATLVNNLGVLLQDMGDLAGARAAYERALGIDELVFGREHPKVAGHINNLGRLLQDQGDLAGARGCFERALAIDERVYGPEHPNVATDFNNLGNVLLALGDLEGAQESFERALGIDERVFGPDHPKVAICVSNLGHVLHNLGDLEGARVAYERALAIDERVCGPDHPGVAICVNNLGGVMKALGDLEGARAAYERALAIDEGVFGPDHANVGLGVNNVGSVLLALGDLEGARGCFERALEIDERVYGPEHPEVAREVNNLGSVLHQLGDLAGARGCFERALAIDERVYGPEHLNVARNVNNLGGVLQYQGDLAGARECYERALGIFEKFLPEGHADIELVRGNLERLEEVGK